MSLGEPRPLTGEELLDFEQSERCRKSWYAKSLLLTIQALREEHYYEQELLTAQKRELQQRLSWFERTYEVRAMEPLFRPRRKGGLCPHCNKHGECGIDELRCCTYCGKVWQRQTDGVEPVTA